MRSLNSNRGGARSAEDRGVPWRLKGKDADLVCPRETRAQEEPLIEPGKQRG